MPAPQSEIVHTPDAAAIRAWLIARIVEEMRVPAEQIDVDRSFTELGLSSVDAAAFSGELAAWLGRTVSPLLLWDYPSIELLARHLGERS